MSAKSYPIPKPLWDAVENVLMVKSKELIKDIAKSLHQSEKPLWEAFKAKKHTFHLLDMEDPTDNKFECEALVCTSAVAHRCRKPVLLGQKVCPEHEFVSQPSLGTKPIVKRIKTDTGETYFMDNQQNVYTEDFERVGILQEDTLVLYTIDDDNEEFA